MTTLNTIIEEEKKEFDAKFPNGVYGVEWHPDSSFKCCWLETSSVKDFLSTAMQRAYEAGRGDGYNAGLADGTDKPLLAVEQIREERDTYWKERVNKDNIMGMIVKNSTGFDTVGNQRLWHLDIDAFESDLDTLLEKITNEDNLK